MNLRQVFGGFTLLLVFFVGLFMLVGCVPSTGQQSQSASVPDSYFRVNVQVPQSNGVTDARDLFGTIVKIDGCEYYIFYICGGDDRSIVHKGNCSNPMHQISSPDVKRARKIVRIDTVYHDDTNKEIN